MDRRRERRRIAETEFEAAFVVGDLDRAATAALTGFASELVGYLIAIAPSVTVAHEAYSQLCLDFWRGLPQFRRDCSLRSWLYLLARRALGDVLADPYAKRAEALSAHPSLLALTATVRSVPVYERSEAQARLAAVRRTLPAEEQHLLILRIDRRLAWNEIAVILDGDPAVLRKRFERLKQRLRGELAP